MATKADAPPGYTLFSPGLQINDGSSAPPLDEMKQPEQSGASPLPDCTIATVLTVVGVLDFVGAVIGGLAVGNGIGTGKDDGNGRLGWMIFFGGILSGIFVLGFAYALKYLHAIAHRLEKIESIQCKTIK